MPYWRDPNGNTAHETVAISNAPAIMSNGLTLFNITGDIQITSLFSECYTDNNATASTLQYAATPTGLVQTTISGASASLASATAGTIVSIDGASLAAAPNIAANGIELGQTARGIIVPAGIITAIVGVGSTTGTWRHYLRYKPMERGAYVTAAF